MQDLSRLRVGPPKGQKAHPRGCAARAGACLLERQHKGGSGVGTAQGGTQMCPQRGELNAKDQKGAQSRARGHCPGARLC